MMICWNIFKLKIVLRCKMRTRLLILIMILVGGFIGLSFLNLTLYKTWANNEHWYYHPDGYFVTCEIILFQSPGVCAALDENGVIVDSKTGIGNWENRK